MIKLLLVEDEPEKLRYMEQVAKGEGRQIITASDLDGARRVLAAQNLDLVVTDLALGSRGSDKDGLEVLRASKAKDIEVPVIMVSNYLTPEDCDDALDEGAFDIIDRSAPNFDPYRMLRLKINQALQLRGALLSH